MTDILLFLFLGFSIIFITYLSKRGYYIRKYFKELPSGERVTVQSMAPVAVYRVPDEEILTVTKNRAVENDRKVRRLKALLLIIFCTIVLAFVVYQNLLNPPESDETHTNSGNSNPTDNTPGEASEAAARDQDSVSNQLNMLSVRMDSISAASAALQQRTDSLEAALNNEMILQGTEKSQSPKVDKPDPLSKLSSLKILDTAFIYNEPSTVEGKTGMYFTPGTMVHFDDRLGNFFHVKFRYDDGTKGEGWIRRSVTDLADKPTNDYDWR